MKFPLGIVRVVLKLMRDLVFVGLVVGSTMLVRNRMTATTLLTEENDL
jgi:hypothetical protein